MSKKWILEIVVLLAGFVLSADTLPFRSGIIFAAETSTKKQNIVNFNEQNYPDLPVGSRIYAAVTLTVFSNRILSPLDYSLDAFGKKYPCVAVRTGDAPWQADPKGIEFPAKNQKYSMLFILDGSLLGFNQEDKMSLHCNYSPANAAGTELFFTNRMQQDFTKSSKIPAAGALRILK